MKYILLIYSNEENAANATQEESMALLKEYQAYTQSMVEAGVFVHTEALQPTATATSVSLRNNESVMTHGPFAETAEQLGGFYLLNCVDLDEAVSWAQRCPTARYGKIEIRPVINFGN